MYLKRIHPIYFLGLYNNSFQNFVIPLEALRNDMIKDFMVKRLNVCLEEFRNDVIKDFMVQCLNVCYENCVFPSLCHRIIINPIL